MSGRCRIGPLFSSAVQEPARGGQPLLDDGSEQPAQVRAARRSRTRRRARSARRSSAAAAPIIHAAGMPRARRVWCTSTAISGHVRRRGHPAAPGRGSRRLSQLSQSGHLERRTPAEPRVRLRQQARRPARLLGRRAVRCAATIDGRSDSLPAPRRSCCDGARSGHAGSRSSCRRCSDAALLHAATSSSSRRHTSAADPCHRPRWQLSTGQALDRSAYAGTCSVRAIGRRIRGWS